MMENQWIVEKMTTLKNLYDEYKMEEKALSRCIGCMIRMLNSLAQMEYSQFHFYERQILVDALRIFTEHFTGQIEETKQELDARKKKELIDDIENAVDSMIGVYKNVIDNTANSDRQILSNISVDTSVYELSPKICAFYSLILNKLVKMFKEDGGDEYAFVLHPTLKSNTETRVMFEQRKKSGKVVIIYISESIIERFDTVVVFLLHEAFHVLTKKERKRKLRFKCLFQLTLAEITQMLFKGVFDDEEHERDKIEDELLRYFFDDCKREIQEWSSKDIDSRAFYSSEVKQWGNSYFNGCLVAINKSLEISVSETILKNVDDLDFASYKLHYEKVERIIQQIRKNLQTAMCENRILSLVDRVLFLCREIYADIACVLTLNLSPDDYQAAFEKSKQFFSDGRYFDSVRVVRNYIVASSVADYMPEKESALWKRFSEKLVISFPQKGAEDDFNKQNLVTIEQTYVIIAITPQMRDTLLEYAQECARAFSERLNSIESMDSFRGCMSCIRNHGIQNKQDLLKRILVGDFKAIFRGI